MSASSAENGRVSCLELPIQLSPRVWRLGTYHLAVFLVRGDGESLLFEVGISSTTPLVLAQLAGLGVDLGEIRYVVLTHAHSDHATGGAGLTASLPKAGLVMSSASLRHMQKPETAESFKEEDIFTTAVIMGKEAADRLAGSSQAQLPAEPLIKEPGDSLQVDGITLELLGADGHVPGGLVGWLPSQGVLLGSDSTGYCSLGRPAYPLYFVSYTDYQANLAKLAALRSEILGLGHQDCFKGRAAAEYLEQTVESLERDHRRVITGLAAGKDEDELARDIFNRYYREELTVFAPQAMLDCCRLLVRRSREHEED